MKHIAILAAVVAVAISCTNVPSLPSRESDLAASGYIATAEAEVDRLQSELLKRPPTDNPDLRSRIQRTDDGMFEVIVFRMTPDAHPVRNVVLLSGEGKPIRVKLGAWVTDLF